MDRLQLKLKPSIFFMLINILMMCVIPTAVAKLAAPQSGMIFTMLLFLIINPIFVSFAGLFAGKNIQKRWFMPAIPPFLFLASSWMVFSFGELAFVIYAGIYLLLGMGFMGIGWLLKKTGNQ